MLRRTPDSGRASCWAGESRFSLPMRTAGRSAVGARCTVEAGGHKQIAEVMSGGSYFSQNSMTLHFGLGKSGRIDRLEVQWPSGELQSWPDVAGNRTLRITEGAGQIASSAW